MRFLKKLQYSTDFWFLFATSVVFFILRFPSLFEPYWYGDEGIYEVIGFALRHGRLLYSGIWDNKPPLLYLVYAIFSGDQTGAKFLSLLAGLGAVWAIFFFSKKLFVKPLAAYVSTAIFTILFATPLIEGNIANAENFMLVLGILAGYLVYGVASQTISLHTKYKLLTPNYFLLFSAGLLVGISFLFKVVGMFDMTAFAVFLFFISIEKLTKSSLIAAVLRLIPFGVGFAVPAILCALYFVLQHTFGIFLHSVLFSNVDYVNYGNQFIIPQGFLILKTALLAGIVFFLFIKRESLSHSLLFIVLWTAFALYSALFSQRPYTHYILVLLPSFALLVGMIFAEKKNQIFLIGITILLLIFVDRSFSFYNKPFSYYINFLSYVAGSKTTTAYQAFFDRVTPRDYQIAAFLSTQTKGSVYLWGNSGQIYKLAETLPPGRFIVAYHVTMTDANYKETQQILEKNPPKYLIVLPNQNNLPLSLSQYKERVIIDNATIYEHII